MMLRMRAALVLALFLCSCGPAPGYGTGAGTTAGSGSGTTGEANPEVGGAPTTQVVPTPPDASDFTRAIPDAATWARLAARPGYNPAARTEVVKVIIDLESPNRLYFLDSNRWDLHFYFILHHIDSRLDHATFNITQYRRTDRRFILATLTHWIDPNLYTFELVAGDTLEPNRIALAFHEVAAQLYFRDALRFRPTGPQHEAAIRTLGTSLPSIAPDAVYAGVRYQPIVVGEAYGYLRRMRAPLDLASLRPNDIVVTDEVPEELSPVAALVTSHLQAPLAHVAVLSRNRSTPDMALRDAFDDPRFTALEGQLVRIRVSPQDFTLERAELRVAEASWAAMRPSSVQVPARDLRPRQLRELCALRYRDVTSVGAKAAQLGEVCRLGNGIVTPGGFAIPFAHYASHLDRTHLTEFARQLVASDTRGLDPHTRAERLAFLRARIADAPIDPTLVADVRRRVLALPDRKHIFRSSTNSEDLAGFNGAGLYESIVVPRSPTEAQVADAIRGVWASVWLERAYAERAWYRVSHMDVSMGILVQPFVSDVVGNGVAVTVNPFDQARPAVFINTQAAGGSVTGAHSDEIPEQFLVYTWAEALEPELLSRSSRTNGQPLLTNDELLRLTSILQVIHNQMQPYYGSRANGMDVEFMLTENPRQFVIVQARPYHVVYEEEQTFRYDD